MIPNVFSCLAKCDHLGVGSGIGISNVAIESPCNHLAVAHNHGSHRHFACLKRTLGGTQRLLHPEFVSREIYGIRRLHRGIVSCGSIGLRPISSQKEDYPQDIRNEQAQNLRNEEAQDLMGRDQNRKSQ